MGDLGLLLGTAYGLGGGASFSPESYPGALKIANIDQTGSQLTLNGSNVINWGIDDVGFIQNTQSVDANRLVRGTHADGLAEHVGDGVSASMVSASNIVRSGGALTLYFVFRATANGLISEYGSPGTDGGFWFTTTNATSIFIASSTTIKTHKDRAVDWGLGNVWRRIVFRWNATHATHQMWINGVLQSMTTGGDADDGGGSANQPMYLFSRLGTSLFLTGAIRADYLYDAHHSDSDLLEIDGHLADYTPGVP